MESSLKIINNISFIAVIIMVAAAIIIYASNIYRQKAVPVQKSGKKKAAAPSFTDSLKSEDFNMNDRLYLIIVIVIAVLGIAIRVWQFGSVPGGFNQDGAMAAVDGKALADYATDRFGTFMPAHLYAWGYGQMSSLLSYMIAVFVKFFGLNPVTARLPQLIMSLAGGTFFYFFIKDIFGKRAALIAAAFVAFNPWQLVQSRWALDCNLLPHFFMGGLFFLNRGLSKRRRYTFISMIFFALCMYCYGITIYTIPPFLLAVCIYYLLKKKLTVKDALISAAIYLLIAWPFLLTMTVNFFKWDTISLPFVTIQYFSGSVRSSDILFFTENPMQQIGSNLSHLMNTTLLQSKDLPWNDIDGFGTMFLCSIPFMAAGAIELSRTKTDGAKGLVTFALLAGVWVGLVTNNVNVNRINIVYYGIMMFIVLGIEFVIKEIKYAKFANIAIYAILSVMLVTTYFGSYADMIKGYFYYGFGDALIAAEESDADKIYVTADAQGTGYWMTSEIITLFYDKTDALYFQGKTNTSGGKELLPYKERFTYESMSGSVVSKGVNENAAFVITQNDVPLFNNSGYEITNYGNFCAAVKKGD